MATQNDDVLAIAMTHDNTTSGDVVNVYQMQLIDGGPVSDADVLDDISAFLESLYIIIEGFINVRNVFQDIVVRNKTQALLIGSTDAGLYVGGTAIGDAAPQGVAPYVHFKTSKPRIVLSKYLPPPAEAQISADGRVATDYQTAILAFAVELTDDLVNNGHTYRYGHDSPVTLSFVLPTVIDVANVFAYQRRRKEGRGS